MLLDWLEMVSAYKALEMGTGWERGKLWLRDCISLGAGRCQMAIELGRCSSRLFSWPRRMDICMTFILIYS